MGKVVNVEVVIRDGQNVERMIKRFCKKVSKEKIIETYIEKSRYRKPSEIKNEKKRRKKKLSRMDKKK
jgi:ribosomal protein S21